jgi:probable F420-dependent oxidoreductase
MQHGLLMFPTHDALDPGSVARLVEDYGFESLFFPDHSHIPSSRLTPFPGGGELERKYVHILDLFVALTAAASATSRLRIGSGICLVIQRDPIHTAKQVASLDHLSNGRVIFGVGPGWNREEMENHGTDPDQRFALMRERVEAIRAIWTEDAASYHGRFVDFDAIWSWPKPVQDPHPPVLLAGNGPGAVDRVLAFADGWCPIAVPGMDARIAELRSRATDAGRVVSVSLFGAPLEARVLAHYREVGVGRFVYDLPSSGREEVERSLGTIRATIDELGG